MKEMHYKEAILRSDDSPHSNSETIYPTFRVKSKLSARNGGVLTGELVVTDGAPVVEEADLQSTFVA